MSEEEFNEELRKALEEFVNGTMGEFSSSSKGENDKTNEDSKTTTGNETRNQNKSKQNSEQNNNKQKQNNGNSETKNNQDYNKAKKPYGALGGILHSLEDAWDKNIDEGKKVFEAAAGPTFDFIDDVIAENKGIKKLEKFYDERPTIKKPKTSEPKGFLKKNLYGAYNKEVLLKMQRRNDEIKAEKGKNIISYANKLADSIIEVNEKRYNEDKIDITSLKTSELRYELQDVRKNPNQENINNLIAKIEVSRSTQIRKLRETLEEMRIAKAKSDLKKYTNLSENEIVELLSGSESLGTFNDALVKGMTGNRIKAKTYLGLGQNGELEITGDFAKKITIDDIRKIDRENGTSIEDELKRVAAMPNIRDLSGEEVLQLAKSIDIKNGRIDIDFSNLKNEPFGNLEWIEEEEKTISNPDDIKEKNEYYSKRKNRSEENMSFIGKSHKGWDKYRKGKDTKGIRLHHFKNLAGKDFYVDGMETQIFNSINGLEDIGTYDRILYELYDLINLNSARMLKEQIKSVENVRGGAKIISDKVSELDFQGIEIGVTKEDFDNGDITPESSTKEMFLAVAKAKVEKIKDAIIESTGLKYFIKKSQEEKEKLVKQGYEALGVTAEELDSALKRKENTRKYKTEK